MSLVKCGNVVELVLFVFIICPNWKAQKSITWDFAVIYALEKWEWIENWATRVVKIDIKRLKVDVRWFKVTFCVIKETQDLMFFISNRVAKDLMLKML